MKEILISKDQNGKIRVADISCEWSDALHAYAITRKTSQLNGKVTEQPIITIDHGKAKRTVTEQSQLEFNSLIKKYCDKGYKNIKDLGYASLDQLDPSIADTHTVTDQNGAPKPQLCKKYGDVSVATFNKKH